MVRINPEFLPNNLKKDMELIEARASAPTSTVGRLMNIGKGDFSKGLAFSLGLPSQLVSLTLNKLGVTETKNPVLGVNDWLTIFHSMGMSGSIPSNERGFYEKIFGRTSEEVGAAAAWIGGLAGLGARAAARGGVRVMGREGQGFFKKAFTDPAGYTRQRAVPEFGKVFSEGKGFFPKATNLQNLGRARKQIIPRLRESGKSLMEQIGADPLRATTRELGFTVGAGAGAGVMQQVIPDSILAEMSGQLLGPLSFTALKGLAKTIPTKMRLVNWSQSMKSLAEQGDATVAEWQRDKLKELSPYLAEGDPRVVGKYEDVGVSAFRHTPEGAKERFELAEKAGLIGEGIDPSVTTAGLNPGYINMKSALDTLVDSNILNEAQKQFLLAQPDISQKRIAEFIQSITPSYSETMTIGAAAQRTFKKKIKEFKEDIKRVEKGMKSEMDILQPIKSRKAMGAKIRKDTIQKFDNSIDEWRKIGDETGVNQAKVFLPEDSIIATQSIVNDFNRLVRSTEGIDFIGKDTIKGITEDLLDGRGFLILKMLGQRVQREMLNIGAKTYKSATAVESFRNLAQFKKRINDMIDSISDEALRLPGPEPAFPTSFANKAILQSRENILDRIQKGETYKGVSAEDLIDPNQSKTILDDLSRQDAQPKIDAEIARLRGDSEINVALELGSLSPETAAKLNIPINASLSERFDAYKKAYFLNHINAFKRGYPQELMRKGPFGFRYTEDEVVAMLHIKPTRQGGATLMEDYIRVHGFDTEDIERGLLHDLWEKTVEIKKGNKVWNTDKAEKWLEDYREVLEVANIDPDKFIANRIESYKMLADERLRLSKREQEWLKGTFVEQLVKKGWSPHEAIGEPIEIVKKALNEPLYMDKLIRDLRGNRPALQGLRVRVFEMIANQGEAKEMYKLLRQHEPSLEKLFGTTKAGKEHLKNLKDIMVLKEMSEVRPSVKPKGGQPLDIIGEVSGWMGTTPAMLGNMLWVLHSRFLPARFVYSRLGLNFFKRIGKDKWNDTIKNVMLDPTMAKDLNRAIGGTTTPYPERLTALRKTYINLLNLGLENRVDILENLSQIIPHEDDKRFKKMSVDYLRQLQNDDYKLKKIDPPTNRLEFNVVPTK